MKKLFPYIFMSALILFYSSCKKASQPTPVADFSYSGNLVTGSIITFLNKSTNATSYSWDFGNSTYTTMSDPALEYTTAGDYTVKLTATGPGGTNSISKAIHIDCSPQVVEVGSTIDVATTWDACHIYHCAYFTNVNAALTIEGGTVVKFDDQKGILVNTGTLTVNGDAGHPVIFTSIKDDSYGGDINGDGNATTPQKGDWHWISFGTSSGSSLNYCKILYAGSGSTDYEQALNMGDGADNSIKNSVIAHTAGGVNQLQGALNMSSCPQSCIAQNNTFFDNGHPVSIGISSDFDNSNAFHNPDNPSQTNVCNGIFVDCVHSVQADLITWGETEVAFVLGGFTGNSWYMDQSLGKKLVLGDNVVIKFARYTTPGFSLYLPDGETQLQNHDGTGVAFTAYTDDSLKGDTNGDGPSSGTDGYWEGIETSGPIWFSWPNIFFAAH
jgi:PKD repeat protein